MEAAMSNSLARRGTLIAARAEFIRSAVPIALLVVGGFSALYRFWYGLGASTQLSNSFPWGAWIGVDLVGIALSAGGFVVAFVVYILGRKSYEGMARAGILVALLGYPLVMAVLVLDLGQPLRFWHALVFWNEHSAMFEVTVCITFYTMVLFAEFAPEIFSWMGWHGLGQRVHRIMPLVAGAGIVLSTLHQSSLGTLYLLAPTQMHPLWFTPLLPILFWATAIQGGLAMVILVHGIAHARAGAEFHADAVRGLGRCLGWILVLTLAGRLVDLAWRGTLAPAGLYESSIFALEIMLGWLLPIVVLATAKQRPARYFLASIFTVMGIMMHRFNVTVTAMESHHHAIYMPSAIEVMTSLAVIAAGVAAFALLARALSLFPPHPGPRLRLVDHFGLATLIAAGLAIVGVLAAVNSEAGKAVGPNAGFEGASESDTASLSPGVMREIVISETRGVLFRHDRHLFACQECHPRLYPMLSTRLRAPGDTDTHQTVRCKTCHDGRHAFAMDTACMSCHEPARMRPYEYRLSSGSPGRVRFEHAKHTTATRGECRTCHQAAGERAWPELTMEPIYRGEMCGRCHDGQRAFGGDACARCHRRGK